MNSLIYLIRATSLFLMTTAFFLLSILQYETLFGQLLTHSTILLISIFLFILFKIKPIQTTIIKTIQKRPDWIGKRRKRVKRNCEICGKEFLAKDREGQRHRFCSSKCRVTNHRKTQTRSVTGV